MHGHDPLPSPSPQSRENKNNKTMNDFNKKSPGSAK